MRVAQKIETIREDLGSVGQVIAEEVEEAMLGRGYNLARTDTAEKGPNLSARCSSSSGTWQSRSRLSWTSTGKPRRNCGSPPTTSRRSWRSG